MEKVCCRKRRAGCTSVPLHPKHEPYIRVQHLLHRGWVCITFVQQWQTMKHQLLRMSLTLVCTKKKKIDFFFMLKKIKQSLIIWIPQGLWSWKGETSWSFWSLALWPTYPWKEILPFWVLSNWLNVCHVTLEQTDVVAWKKLSYTVVGGAVATQQFWWSWDKNTGSSYSLSGRMRRSCASHLVLPVHDFLKNVLLYEFHFHDIFRTEYC